MLAMYVQLQSSAGPDVEPSDITAAALSAMQKAPSPDTALSLTMPASAPPTAGSQLLLSAASAAAVGGITFWVKVNSTNLYIMAFRSVN